MKCAKSVFQEYLSSIVAVHVQLILLMVFQEVLVTRLLETLYICTGAMVYQLVPLCIILMQGWPTAFMVCERWRIIPHCTMMPMIQLTTAKATKLPCLKSPV